VVGSYAGMLFAMGGGVVGWYIGPYVMGGGVVGWYIGPYVMGGGVLV
jgi:hypothetical protein